MPAPCHNWYLCVVVIGEIIIGHIDRKPKIAVAFIFKAKRISVIFGVSCDINLPALFGCDYFDIGDWRRVYNFMFTYAFNCYKFFGCVALMGIDEIIMKAT